MTLNEVFAKLTSKDPRERMESAMLAVNKEYWLCEPPNWFSANAFPEVIGFDSEKVIIGTNLKNIKIVNWDELRVPLLFEPNQNEDFFKKVG